MPAKNPKKRRTRVTPIRTSEVLDVKVDMVVESIGGYNKKDPGT
jgi:hypothetical protein